MSTGIPLKLKNNAKEIIARTWFTADKATDYWMHVGFEFDGDTTEVVVEYWQILTYMGVEVVLNELPLTTLQFIVQALAEEVAYVQKHAYDELEADYYQMLKDGSPSDDDYGRS